MTKHEPMKPIHITGIKDIQFWIRGGMIIIRLNIFILYNEINQV